MTETTLEKNQCEIRAQIENLRENLYDERIEIVHLLNDLRDSFKHNIQNTWKLLQEFDTKNFIDFEQIDTRSEIDYLIEDHDRYSSILSNIEKLRNFQKMLQQYQKLIKQLD